ARGPKQPAHRRAEARRGPQAAKARNRMRRFRSRRRRIAVRALPALVLLPSVAITMAATDATAGKASRATLKAGTSKTAYGRSFRLSGTVPAAAPSRVVIDYRPLGGSRWVERRHLDIGPGGRYSTPLTARRSGVYRARSTTGRPSRTVEVAVA